MPFQSTSHGSDRSSRPVNRTPAASVGPGKMKYPGHQVSATAGRSIPTDLVSLLPWRLEEGSSGLLHRARRIAGRCCFRPDGQDYRLTLHSTVGGTAGHCSGLHVSLSGACAFDCATFATGLARRAAYQISRAMIGSTPRGLLRRPSRPSLRFHCQR